MKYQAILLIALLAVPLIHGEQDTEAITFAMVGDIMLGTDYPEPNLPPEDGSYLLEEAGKYLREADVAIGNLEGTITSEQECAKVVNEGFVYAFRTPPYLSGLLGKAGFDVLNTANNHSRDFGLSGTEETEMILASLGIQPTGRRGTAAILEVRKTTIAVIGFSPYEADNSLLEIDKAVAFVDSIDEVVDIIVVTFHGGAEGASNIHLSDSAETYLGEDRGDLRQFAHSVVDAGADIVFGHGPHVPRAMEVYSNRIIAYSLGNFCTWKGLKVSGVNGLAPLLWVEVSESGELVDLQVISFEQQTQHYPLLDSLDRAGKLMLELSRTDIGALHPMIEKAIHNK